MYLLITRASITTAFLLLITGSIYAVSDDCKSDWDWDNSGLTVTFINDSEADVGYIVEYLWSFGDGNISTDENPVHIYSTPGTYDVCLSISTSEGCVDISCADIDVSAGECEADFNWDDGSLMVSFSDNSDGGGDAIISYLWSFGDGGTSTESDPVHTYATEGSYDVCLTITTATGCVSTKCEGIDVEISGGGGSCNAFFVITDIIPDGSGFMVYLDNQTTGGMAGGSTPWTWVYSDDTPWDTTQDAMHYFAEPGIYMICLTAGQAGADCFDQYCEEISLTATTVEEEWITGIKVQPNPANQSITLSEMQTDGILRIYSIFGSLVSTYQLHSGTTNLDISYLPDGNYIGFISGDHRAIRISVQH